MTNATLEALKIAKDLRELVDLTTWQYDVVNQAADALEAIAAANAEPTVQVPSNWKSGNEYAPYHPSASHVRPDYRDGWNACYQAAIANAAEAKPMVWFKHGPYDDGEPLQVVFEDPHDDIFYTALIPFSALPDPVVVGGKPEPIELQQIARMIADKFAGHPDEYSISIGDWKTDPILGAPMKEFHAYMCVPLGDWRKYAALPVPMDAQPDPQLLKFYQVKTGQELVAAMARHIEKLQAKLPSTPDVFTPRFPRG